MTVSKTKKISKNILLNKLYDALKLSHIYPDLSLPSWYYPIDQNELISYLYTIDIYSLPKNIILELIKRLENS